ncbi:MAG: LysR substrate-binding domain-containing protein [Achromobacter sp.]|uniref:LysR substrate-binding domain-containing protein n=1 Tax=Achromobacter sp. TaxID=134375 RepID=UPI0029A0FBB4|nr:LysR substrate-binding domain-containing protein [Achromobacter sp.]MDX3985819.1 LysR substrate-binding domain-containing protein [Achromobacter sp.]
MFSTLPVTALRAFEAAARLRSFKLAAAELAVTPTAVSHQIKSLERQVGFPLFDRAPRSVKLTDKGARLFISVHGALLDIAQTLDALRPEPASGALTLSTTHSFAALWLVPRLGRFHQAFPQYQLNLQTGADPVDLLQDASVDVAVRYSRRAYPALHTAATLPEWFGVYGAPGLIAQMAKTRAAKAAPALVTVRWRDSDLYEQGWLAWCQAARMPAWREPAAVHAYAEEHYALQAAIAGQGLVLASSVMVSDSVRAGTLAAYRPQVRVPGAAYTALCAPGRERHPPVRAFLAWLTREFQA